MCVCVCVNVCLIIRLSSDTESVRYTVQSARQYHWSLCQNPLHSGGRFNERSRGRGRHEGRRGETERGETERGESVQYSIGETFLLYFIALISGLYRLHSEPGSLFIRTRKVGSILAESNHSRNPTAADQEEVVGSRGT